MTTPLVPQDRRETAWHVVRQMLQGHARMTRAFDSQAWFAALARARATHQSSGMKKDPE